MAHRKPGQPPVIDIHGHINIRKARDILSAKQPSKPRPGGNNGLTDKSRGKILTDVDARLADMAGQLAESEAEIVRLKKVVADLEAENLQRRQKRMRPETLRGVTRRMETPLGTMYVTITEDEKGQPFEVFMSLGKAGGALMADVEAIGRLISLALRSGIPMKEIHRQIRGISSDRVIGLGANKVMSVPDAVGIAIERWMQEKQGVQTELPGITPMAANGPAMEQIVNVTAGAQQMSMKLNEPTLAGACPDCGSQLEMAEGCAKCHVCGFSECG